jgi:hypothetical protein
VERLFNTLQDRLIAELRLAGIKTIPKANIFLKEVFIPRFNQRFGVSPRSSESRYRKLSADVNLEIIFCKKDQRKVNHAHSFSWNAQTYVIENSSRDFRFRTININTHLNGTVSFDIMGINIDAKLHQVQRKNHIYPRAS